MVKLVLGIIGFVLLCTLALYLSVAWIMSTIWMFTPWRPFKRFYQDKLGWHEPDPKSNIGFDGCSLHCTCRFCGKEIMQDSQGNWF